MGELQLDIDPETRVSCMNYNTMLQFVMSEVGDISHLFEGSELTEEFVSDPNHWIDWNHARKLVLSIQELLGNQDPDLFYEIGVNMSKLRSVGILENMVRLFGNPRFIVSQIPKYNRRFNRIFDMDVSDLGNNSATVTIGYNPLVRDTSIYLMCPWNKGIIATIPTIWDLPVADINEPRCIFTIEEVIEGYSHLGLELTREDEKVLINGQVYGKEVHVQNNNGRNGVAVLKDLSIDGKVVLTSGRIYGAPHCQYDMKWQNPSLRHRLVHLPIQRLKQYFITRAMIERQLEYSESQFFELQGAHKDLQGAQTQLKEYAEHLEEMVEARTAELREAQAQLVQSEKMASLGQLSAGIAHEMGNALLPVRPSVDTLEEYRQVVRDLSQNVFEQIFEPNEFERYKFIIHQFIQSCQIEEREVEANAEAMEYLFEERNVPRAIIVAESYAKAGLKGEDVKFIFGLADKYLISEEIFRKIFDFASVYERRVRNLGEGVQRVSTIVNAILGFSRHEKETVALTNIAEDLQTTVSLINHEAKKKNVQIVTEYGSIPEFYGKVADLNQAWLNLLKNGIEAVEDKGMIRLETFQERDSIVVRFSNNGPEIPEDLRTKIFDPFFTTKAKGLGFGLSQCYNAISDHDGQISVYSSPELTVFEVRLPKEPKDL
ncbi:MAG: ATP-binding protein [Candidatus Woesearchaeota archaeon]